MAKNCKSRLLAVASIRALLSDMKRDAGSQSVAIAKVASDLACDLAMLARAARGIRDLANANLLIGCISLEDDDGPIENDGVFSRPHYYTNGCGRLDAINGMHADLAESARNGVHAS